MTEEFRDSGFTPGFNFDEYIRQSEPSKKEKGKAWATAIGLQQVDGLEPSAYLYETARRNIEGEISIDEANRLVNNYYETRSDLNGEERTEEADKVSARIARILSEKSFRFSPSYLIAIHKELFDGIYRFSGVLRDYDITKKEWVLRGDTVLYGAAFELRSALDYDFEQERRFSYKDLTPQETVSRKRSVTLRFLFPGFGKFIRLRKAILEQRRFSPSSIYGRSDLRFITDRLKKTVIISAML